MDKFRAIENYYHRLIDELIQFASTFTIDVSHKLQVFVVCLYGSIIELSSSIIPLLKSEHFSAIPVILRSIIEAYIDLENLCKDPKYGYSLEIKYLVEYLKFLKEARNEQNPYLGIVAKAPGFEEKVSKMEMEKDRLIRQGYKDFNRYEKFAKAGLENEYRSIYNWLCCDSHNDYRALFDRHFDSREDRLTIHLFKEADFQRLEMFFGIASELLIRASLAIHTLFSSEKLVELARLRAELDALKGEA